MAIVNGSLQEGYKDAAWFAANPTLVLLVGQKVNLEQTGTYKLGDGTTQLSALSFLGGSGSGLSGLTTNKVLKATSSTTAGDSQINDTSTNGYPVVDITDTGISSNFYNGVVASNVNIDDASASMSFYDGTDSQIITTNILQNKVKHSVKNTFDAPLHEFNNSVTKNGVEVATVNDIPTVDTTIIDGSTNAVSGNAVFDGLATKVSVESIVLNPAGTLNPADATTYYFGSFISTAPTTLAAARRVYLGKDCSIIGATFSLLVSSTLGSAEDINVYIRVNNTTDYLIGTIKANSATQQVLINTSMSVVLTSTDYFEMKMVMPPFVTNPVTVSFTSVVNVR